MSGLAEIVARPEFFVSAGFIVGGSLLALWVARRRAMKPEPQERPVEPQSLVPAAPVPKAGVEVVRSSAPSVSFSDIAGLDDAVAELAEVRDYLCAPQRFEALGAELPRGILLHGPPGCGKTLLARALAGEAGVSFHHASAAEFVERYVGLGAARVRELFTEARRSSPAILFLDELDALGRHRSGAEDEGGREYDHTLNQLLVDLDGFEVGFGLLVLGATNRPELIDPALLRPGRFDRRIRIDLPDRRGREQVLRLHARRRPVSSEVDWGEVADQTAGLSPAELAGVVNEAALLAARRGQGQLTAADVEDAIGRIVTGTPVSRVMSEEEKHLVAVHEGGHAVLTLLLRGMRPPPRVSILHRGSGFERSMWTPAADRGTLTRHELLTQLIVLLGGRGAEMVVLGEPTTGAEDDLEHAAGLARRMVQRWAMTGRYDLAGGSGDPPAPVTEGGAGADAVRHLVSQAERAAMKILRDNQVLLTRITDALVRHETLSAAQLEAFTQEPAALPVHAGDRTGRFGPA
jgi:cell division protease FtsH